MKKYYFLLLCFLIFSVLSAQEKLTKEEQARREKNIQAGNPFAKFGYKAKVATLSKGKYLEVHDLDSIVTIGSIRYHVDKNQIVGNIVIDTTDMYARPIGDTPSRWLSPDPLSEEFSDWSPYSMSFDNPIKYVDTDGMAPTDIVILGANNSSVTIKTNLINVSVNASSLGVDFGGRHSLAGNDIVQAGLDIVGIFDPTGVADAVNAGISANSGNWGDAIISGLGVIPLAGDLAKVGKIEKDIKIIDNAIDTAKGADKVRDAVKTESKLAGDLPVPGKGKGSVPPSQRDPQRVYTQKQKSEMLESQGGKCASCGDKKTVGEVAGHHKVRHADGGKTTIENGAAVCKDCHTEIHK